MSKEDVTALAQEILDRFFAKGSIVSKDDWDFLVAKLSPLLSQAPVEEQLRKCTRDGTFFVNKCPTCGSTNGYAVQQKEQKEGVCHSHLATRPILYTDTVGGKQTMRDDLWAVTTKELNSFTPQTPTLDCPYGCSGVHTCSLAEAADSLNPQRGETPTRPINPFNLGTPAVPGYKTTSANTVDTPTPTVKELKSQAYWDGYEEGRKSAVAVDKAFEAGRKERGQNDAV